MLMAGSELGVAAGGAPAKPRDERISQLLSHVSVDAVLRARQDGVQSTIVRLGDATESVVEAWYVLCERHGIAALVDVDVSLRSVEASGRRRGIRALAPFIARRAGAPEPEANTTELATLLAIRALEDADPMTRISAVGVAPPEG